MITLKISTLSISFKTFLDPVFPRTRAVKSAEMNYSNHGNSVGLGIAYEAPYIWTFNAVITPEEKKTINYIFTEFNHRRTKKPPLDCDILLIDALEEYQERYPRTRAIAPGATETIDGDYVSYYAQFMVWPVEDPKYDKSGSRIFVHLAFQESKKKPA